MALHPRNILSLCAGVGGLELGILLALHHRGEAGRGVCYVEREGAAAASLVASMEAGWLHPAPVWSDMLTFDARPWRGLVHILASGDPCQDNSVAGKREGKDGKRFLAPEVCRLAEECRPDLIFRENVPGNADGQLAAIAPTLEGLGYRVAAGIFSSSATGNTMRRERLFIMAVREDQPRGMGAGPERECLSDAGGGGAGVDGSASPERWALNGSCGTDRADALSQRQEGAVGAGIAGAELVQPEGVRPGEGRAEHAGQQGRCAASGAGGELGGANGGRCEGISGRGQGGTPQPSPGVAGAAGAGLQGRQPGQSSGSQRPSAQRGRLALPPAVIPGPTDSRWIDVLDRFPELQPALSEEEAQSHLRRGIDAVAHRVERLRATGNGVDPITAAYAFLCLQKRLAE